MANLAIYRKYRPATFEDVYGQDTVIKILRNQIINDRIGHAYLFSGIRGTGKTSIAKIFAKAVNCQNPINGEACGVCENCKALNQDSNMNIIEIDAASNRGVDEIRDIKDKVRLQPGIGKYKVYIIDEAHMLTKEAFNALLKTLEEPPSHAIFILATTEAHRLPATILSRCQKFNIKPISDDLILERLKEICEKENIQIEIEGLKEIAKRGEHSMRDSLSLLDQCADLNLPGELIRAEEIQDFLGISPKSQLITIAQLLAEKNGAELLKVLNEYRKQGREDIILLEDLTRFFQSLLYFKITNSKDNNYNESFNELKNYFSQEDLYTIIDTLVQAYSRLRFNSLSEIVTNTALLGLCSDNEKSNSEKEVNLSEKSIEIKQNIENTRFKVEQKPLEQSFKEKSKKEQSSKTNFNEETTNSSNNVESQQTNIVSKTEANSFKIDNSGLIDLKNFQLELIEQAEKQNEKIIKKLIENSDFKYNKNGLFIFFDEQYRFLFDTLDFSKRIQNLVNQVFGKTVKIFPKIKQDYEKYLKEHQNSQKTENKESFDPESHIKNIIGSNDLNYSKVDN